MSLPATILIAVAGLLSPPPAEPDYGEIVVTGSRRPLQPLEEPIAYFRRHCFEPLRRARRAAPPPETGSNWELLPDAERRRLRIDDPATPAFWLHDPERRQVLILKFEQPERADRLQERKCTMVVIGGSGHGALGGGMARLFRGPGTDRHVGHPDGMARLAGWRQRVWTATPVRGSTAWQAPRNSWVVVASPSYYDRLDFVIGDLRSSEGRTPPVSILTLSFTTRGDRSGA
jgi:hypothetical protein